MSLEIYTKGYSNRKEIAHAISVQMTWYYNAIGKLTIVADADDYNLFMCNRSTIVNREYVYAIDSTNCFVVLRDGRGLLDIGLKYRAEINADFSN